MFCYHCMRKINEGSTYCPHCGRQSFPDRDPHYLAAGSTLNDRYLIGNPMGEDGFSISYIARDLNIDERVAVKEFYPMGLVTRDSAISGRVSLKSEQEDFRSSFERGKDKFLQEARLSRQNGTADVRDIFSVNGTVYVVTSLTKDMMTGATAPDGAPLPYEDGFEGGQQNPNDMTDIGKKTPQKKKVSGGMIALIVIASLVVVGLIITMIVLFSGKGKGKTDQTATTVPTTVAATTVKEKEKETQAEDKSVTMIDVKGKKLSDAQSQLQALGLKVETSREQNADVAKDYIIRQSVEAGQKLQKGDTVMLYVSDGYEEVVTTQETHADPAFNSAQGSSVLSGYEAENVLNNDAKCWATEKDGKDAFITLRANGDQWVKGVYFGNGNIGDFQNWGRVTNVRFEFSDGTSVEKSISDISDLQTIDFGREVKTNSMKITILDSKAGAEHESTCITYIKAY